MDTRRGPGLLAKLVNTTPIYGRHIELVFGGYELANITIIYRIITILPLKLS